MTHFLVTDDKPDGYKLEDILQLIRKDILIRAQKITDDPRAEAKHVMRNNMKILNLISEAITLLLERSKLLVEGAGAVGVAALLAGKVGGTGSVCPVLSGGNIDPTTVISVLRHGMTVAGRYLVMRTRVVDRPGELIKLLQLVARERGSIVQIEHRREGVRLDVADTGVDLTVMTRNEAHCLQLIDALVQSGFPVERLR